MKNNAYLLLLLKQLKGEISPDEAAQLYQWRAETPENDKAARDYILLWEKAGSFNKEFKPDLDVAFAKVQAAIKATSAPQLESRTFFKKYIRIAAAVALLALSVVGYRYIAAGAQQELVAFAGDSEKQLVELQDGTRVWLRKGSSLHYPKTFSGQERLVNLSGEGYFEVAHDPAHPFRVGLDGNGYVQVLGTEFGISQHVHRTSVLVRSGRVQYSPDGKIQGPVLIANQKAEYNDEQRKLQVSNVTSLNELSWQTGGLEFVNTPLSQVIRDLEKYYHATITLQNQDLAGCPHSSPLTKDSLRNVLDGIAAVYNFKLKQTGPDQYELTGGTCPNPK